MVSSQKLSDYGRAYISAVIGLGFVVIGISLHELIQKPVGYQWFLLAGLTLISGSATVKLPGVYASISISETFVITAMLLFGPAAGTVIVALDGLVISFWLAKRHPEAYRPLFNMSAPAISAWCAAHLFFFTSGISPLISEAVSLNAILIPLILFAFTYFAINSWLIALVIAFERRINPFDVWPSSFWWLSLNYFSGASVAVLLVVYNRHVDLTYIGVIVPLLLLLYFTFKTSWVRVEDAQKHVDQINKLYMSTIETLAMAIDAKDQITHGHIRRVQTYAVGLAQQVGVTDSSLIKAIEAAALLHDTGKLAVPEYILNKPGKLTAAEFDKMKLHASVGADILSAIEFPYPVVPIVRHHHENWDGTGYPHGLKGTSIPVGARILAVVDCFDALTSDRPYRPRLADEEAIRILVDRRGSMYDPMIVDAFIAVHAEIAPNASPVGPSETVLDEITNATVGFNSENLRLEEIAASSDEMLTLYELSRALGGQAGLGDTGDAIAKHLRRLIPCSLAVFYLYDMATDELVGSHAFGEIASAFHGLRIALGERLSGWVAANRQTIINSDPTLDFGEAARASSPRLRSCLSTPLLADDELVGVLSLYSSMVDGFNADHKRIIEVVAPQIAHSLAQANAFEQSPKRDIITGLPDLNQLDHLLIAQADAAGSSRRTSTLLLIDVIGLKAVNAQFGRATGDDVLRHVVRHIQCCLRAGDLLFRSTSDELVVLLNDTDVNDTRALGQLIVKTSRERPLVLAAGFQLPIETSFGCAAVPVGRTAREIVASAKLRTTADLREGGTASVH